MRNTFSFLRITKTIRVSAFDVNTTITMWENNRLVFHPSVRLEHVVPGKPTWEKHLHNVYKYPEAACLLSHLKTIKQAYEHGHEQVLVLEDDALITRTFKDQLQNYVEMAPLGWKILQFAIVNSKMVEQCHNLVDPFISWQPYHWSTRAYMINRAGMQALLDKTYSMTPSGNDVWQINEKLPIVVADEVLYYLVGDAYTSTKLWVDQIPLESTIQGSTVSTARQERNMGDREKMPKARSSALIQEQTQFNPSQLTTEGVNRFSSYSLLVLMSVDVYNSDHLHKILQWMWEDAKAVCKYHSTCDWDITFHFGSWEGAMLQSIRAKLATMTDKWPNFQVHVDFSPLHVNIISFVKGVLKRRSGYDLLLLKDHDQRLAGFPWADFLKQRGDAVTSSPLREESSHALKGGEKIRNDAHGQFYEAQHWLESTRWSPDLFQGVLPIEVPLLESYLVLFDANFASVFFDFVSTSGHVGNTNELGPLLWCSAAKEWDESRTGCNLIPVVSKKETVEKNLGRYVELNRSKAVESMGNNERFKDWMEIPMMWQSIVGNSILPRIEIQCRKQMKQMMSLAFIFEECPKFLQKKKKYAVDLG